MSNQIFNSIFKNSQYPFVAFHLFIDMYILIFFFFFNDFARLIFSFKKFQEMGTKSPFLSFQNSFSASYFPISDKPLDQNSS